MFVMWMEGMRYGYVKSSFRRGLMMMLMMMVNIFETNKLSLWFTFTHAKLIDMAPFSIFVTRTT